MKNLFLIVLICIVYACTDKKTTEYRLLTGTEMVSILSDIHLLEAKLSKLGVNKDSMSKVYNTFERELLKGHGIDQKHYNESFQYYMAHPTKLERIYEVVIDSLNYAEQIANLAQMKIKEEKENRRLERNRMDSTARAERMAKAKLEGISAKELRLKDSADLVEKKENLKKTKIGASKKEDKN